MKHISIGGLNVSRIGLGAMSMSGYYNIGAGSDAESIRTIHRALELGVTHIDTAEIYGPYANEELVGRAIKGRRDEVVLATKFGLVSHSGGGPGVIDSSPANIRAAVEGSLKRLGTDHIDLYYLRQELLRGSSAKRCGRGEGRHGERGGRRAPRLASRTRRSPPGRKRRSIAMSRQPGDGWTRISSSLRCNRQSSSHGRRSSRASVKSSTRRIVHRGDLRQPDHVMLGRVLGRPWAAWPSTGRHAEHEAGARTAQRTASGDLVGTA